MGTVLFHLIHITNKMFTKPSSATLHSHYYIIFAKTRNKFYLSYMSLFKDVRKRLSNSYLAFPSFFKFKKGQFCRQNLSPAHLSWCVYITHGSISLWRYYRGFPSYKWWTLVILILHRTFSSIYCFFHFF